MVLDTSGLLAALDADQRLHDPARAALESDSGPFLLSPLVLAELDYLLATRVGQEAETALLDEVARGTYRLASFEAHDVEEAARIVRRYPKLGLGARGCLGRGHRRETPDDAAADPRRTPFPHGSAAPRPIVRAAPARRALTDTGHHAGSREPPSPIIHRPPARWTCSACTSRNRRAGYMLLTITTTHRPATDLGYLLHKHPDAVRTVDLAFGPAHVFFPEASDERCTAALLLEVDPVGLIRRDRGGTTGSPWPGT